MVTCFVQHKNMSMFRMRNRTAALIITLASGAAASSLAAEGEHWSYSGDHGPQEWGELSPDFVMCGMGKNQSPIDLSGGIDTDLPELSFDYPNRGLVGEVNTGHTLQENLKPGNFLTVRGKRFEAKQFHFHSPSEHRIDGKSFPLAIHLVHVSEAGNLVVVGILFEEGERNALLDQLSGFRPPHLPPYTGLIDHNILISSRREYYTYNGSLTTPPCTEGVYWVVLKNPIFASKEQIDRFRETMGADTNRPVQPLNSRTVLE